MIDLNKNIPLNAKGERPVAVRHLAISRFVFSDGGVLYRAMPLNARDTPEDSIELALNGLGLLVPVVEAYTDDHDGETVRLVKQLMEKLYKNRGDYAAVWPRAESIQLPNFNWDYEKEIKPEIPPSVSEGDQGGETASGSITGSL